MEEKNCQYCGATFIAENPENNFAEWICKECGFPKKISLLDEEMDDPARLIISELAFDAPSKLEFKINDETLDESGSILKTKMNKLFPVEKIVISALYGIDDGALKTLEEVAKNLNTDIKTIKQIEKNALRRLYKV